MFSPIINFLINLPKRLRKWPQEKAVLKYVNCVNIIFFFYTKWQIILNNIMADPARHRRWFKKYARDDVRMARNGKILINYERL